MPLLLIFIFDLFAISHPTDEMFCCFSQNRKSEEKKSVNLIPATQLSTKVVFMKNVLFSFPAEILHTACAVDEQNPLYHKNILIFKRQPLVI